MTLSLIEAPGVFGDIACLNGTPYTATVEALSSCLTVALPVKTWLLAIDGEPRVAALHYKTLARRFIDATTIQRHSIDVRPVERVAALLLSYTQHTGVPVDGGTLIDVVIAQEDIAEQTACARRTVVRALAELLDSGTLKRHGRKLVVVDVAKLARAALAPPV